MNPVSLKLALAGALALLLATAGSVWKVQGWRATASSCPIRPGCTKQT